MSKIDAWFYAFVCFLAACLLAFAFMTARGCEESRMARSTEKDYINAQLELEKIGVRKKIERMNPEATP